jgi:hypothetical protein
MLVGVAILVAVVSLPAYGEEKSDGKAADKVLADVKKQIAENDKAKDKVKAFATEVCLALCTNEVFVKEVEAQNAKKVSLDEIKKIDKEWMAAEEELAIQKEKTSNACAKAIREIAKKNPVILEAFVMDNQGAVVGENNLTSDYWQGDEPKWANSFKDGKGGFDVGKESFDKSANATVQQVSLPIVNAEGKVIGAVTYGLDTSKL